MGAFWGAINTTVHKDLGLSGALTDGVMRDLGDLPARFPVVAGFVGPSHGFVDVRSIGQPVALFGLTVRPGDLIHADCLGPVVIPPDLLLRLGPAIEQLQATERLVLEAARAESFGFATFEAAWAAFEAART